jgi:hypothetical protein
MRRLDREVVMSHLDGPRCRGFQLLSSATSHRLDTLADSNDELPSLTDLLSLARPVALREAPQAIDLTIDSSGLVA